MKTTHDSSKASDGKSPWWCWVLWWLEAFALLVIMIAMSAVRGFQRRGLVTLDAHHGFAENPSAA